MAYMGDLASLVRRLRSSRKAEQLQAAAAIAELADCGSPGECEAIAAAGAVGPLVQQLQSGSAAVQRQAAMALHSLVSDSDNSRVALVDAGGIAALAGLLSDGGSSSEETLCAAAGAVADLAFHSKERCQALVEAGAVPALVQLCSHRNVDVVAMAACALCNLSGREHTPDSIAAIAAAGGIAALAKVANNSGSTESAIHFAAGALGNMASDSAERCGAVVATGCIPRLVQLLRGQAGEEAQLAAARALSNISACDSTAVAAACGASAVSAVLSSSDRAEILAPAADMVNALACHGQLSAADATQLLPVLEQLSSHQDKQVRVLAAAACSMLREHWVQPTTAKPQSSDPAAAVAAAAATQPAIEQPRQHSTRVCAAPGCSATAGLRRCGGCGSVRYCSEACSKAHWRAHKAECRRLQAEQATAARSSD